MSQRGTLVILVAGISFTGHVPAAHEINDDRSDPGKAVAWPDVHEDFNQYGEAAERMIRSLGVDPGRYAEFLDQDLRRSLGLSSGVFFAREDITRLHETQVDYLVGLSPAEKRD